MGYFLLETCPRCGHGNTYGDILDEGLELPRGAGGHDLAVGRGDAAEGGHGEFPADDDHHHPGGPDGNPAHGEHDDEGSGHDELVSERVEELADVGDHLTAPGQPAVDEVGHGRDDEAPGDDLATGTAGK
jgi:hypothetical protein